MKTRTLREIEQAFREMGLTEQTWGREPIPEPEMEPELSSTAQVFIRIETTTTPLEEKTDADLA